MLNYTIAQNLLELIKLIFILVLFSLSSFFVTLCFYLSVNNEWSIASYYSHSNFDFFLQTFPYLFLLPIILSFIVSIIIYASSKSKNDFSIYKFTISFIVLMVVVSASCFYVGLAKHMNNSFSQNNFYNKAIAKRFTLWSNPDFGFLEGKIGIINDLTDFLLFDYSGKTWKIHINKSNIEDQSIIRTGNNIKLIGRKDSDTAFIAEEIYTYEQY